MCKRKENLTKVKLIEFLDAQSKYLGDNPMLSELKYYKSNKKNLVVKNDSNRKNYA